VSHVKYELGFYIPEDGILHDPETAEEDATYRATKVRRALALRRVSTEDRSICLRHIFKCANLQSA
jgi:hypothetical protein